MNEVDLKQENKKQIMYPKIEVYSQRKADTPEASPILASGIFCSSTRKARDFRNSVGHEVGVEAKGLPKSGNAPLILSMDHENSNAKSLSWSFSVSSFSTEKRRKD